MCASGSVTGHGRPHAGAAARAFGEHHGERRDGDDARRAGRAVVSGEREGRGLSATRGAAAGGVAAEAQEDRGEGHGGERDLLRREADDSRAAAVLGQHRDRRRGGADDDEGRGGSHWHRADDDGGDGVVRPRHRVQAEARDHGTRHVPATMGSGTGGAEEEAADRGGTAG